MSRIRVGTYAGILAVTFIGGAEGYRSHAYPDSIGVPTICYGETKGVHLGDVKTKAECDAMFVKRLDEFGNAVQRCLTGPVSDKTLVSFVSLGYNIGSGGFCRSSVAHKWNAGDHKGACDAMLRFDRAGGRVLSGLKHRREAERKLCREGLTDKASGLPSLDEIHVAELATSFGTGAL